MNNSGLTRGELQLSTASHQFLEEKQCKVLLVEDEMLILEATYALLKTLSPRFEISKASCLKEARLLIDCYDFDLALIDLQLRNGESGRDLLDIVIEKGYPTRCIIISGTEETSAILSCLDHGASGYISKGSDDSETFHHALNLVLSGGIYLPELMVAADRSLEDTRGNSRRSLDDFKLTEREVEVLYYVCCGMSNKAIARRLGIAEGTVRKNYVSALLREFGVFKRTELIIKVSRLGIMVPSPRN